MHRQSQEFRVKGVGSRKLPVASTENGVWNIIREICKV